MRPSTRDLTLLLVMCALFAVPALTDDSETHSATAPDMDAAMAAMEKAAAPGEQHRFLAAMEGAWSLSSKVWMEPGTPPMESGGKSRKSMIMDGRYLQEETEGSIMGQPFHGRAVTAFDNTAAEFIGTWIDSMSTTVAVVRGQRDGDKLEMHGEYLDPMSQQMMTTRYVTRVVSDDQHVFEYYMTMPGAPEFKSMEIVYRRAQ